MHWISCCGKDVMVNRELRGGIGQSKQYGPHCHSLGFSLARKYLGIAHKWVNWSILKKMGELIQLGQFESSVVLSLFTFMPHQHFCWFGNVFTKRELMGVQKWEGSLILIKLCLHIYQICSLCHPAKKVCSFHNNATKLWIETEPSLLTKSCK